MKLDSRKLEQFLKAIEVEKLKPAIRSGMTQSLNIIKRKAVQNLMGVTTAYNKPDKWGLTLLGGVIVKVSKSGLSGRTEIISNSNKGNFKLKFFENGTVGRYNKSGQYRGKMEATHFFSKAVADTSQLVEQSLQSNLENAIEKIYKKYNQ